MSNIVKQNQKEIRQRRYLAKDFDQLRSTIVDYARTYYPNSIQDFSENGLGGLLLDFAVAVGDNMSYYLDHQYAELDSDTAVENANIENLLRKAGVPIIGSSPAIVSQTFFVKVPAALYAGGYAPQVEAIPIIRAYKTIVGSSTGIRYTLVEDVDFSTKDSNGSFLANIKIGDRTSSGTPVNYIMSLNGICISGTETSQSLTIGSTFVPFRKIKLDFPNVSQIMKVYDSYGNIYYEVSSLTNDHVYANVDNTSSDSQLVNQRIKIIPAPYRFIKSTDLATRSTTLTFGGGSSLSPGDDAVPDPLDFAISIPYSTTFSRVAVNPYQLLTTKTLGIATTNTTLTIQYRYGGGKNHNAPVGAIRNILTLGIDFTGSITASQQSIIRASVETTNFYKAVGGDDPPSIDDLKSQIPGMISAQERVVTKEDLLARVLTLPTNFGRVFRAAVRANPRNPLATQLFIVSKDDHLIISPDTLKKNLVTYIAPYRMISDAIDILDSTIVNFKIEFEISSDPVLNKSTILQNILQEIKTYFDVNNFQIDQPINISEVNKLISGVIGVQSVIGIKFTSLSGTDGGRQYSNVIYDMSIATKRGFIFPPDGGIFELKFPDFDIIGSAILCIRFIKQ